MRRIEQTKLSDFMEKEEDSTPVENSNSESTSILTLVTPPPRPKGKMWYKTISSGEKWGVCNFDGTVLFTLIGNNRLHAHGEEIVCKWCEGGLEIRDNKVFCIGACKRYQGEYSDELDSFLHWEGVKSYTLRKIVAESEGLTLEPRDLEPISYAPNWSVLYDYADEMDSDEIL